MPASSRSSVSEIGLGWRWRAPPESRTRRRFSSAIAARLFQQVRAQGRELGGARIARLGERRVAALLFAQARHPGGEELALLGRGEDVALDETQAARQSPRAAELLQDLRPALPGVTQFGGVDR